MLRSEDGGSVSLIFKGITNCPATILNTPSLPRQPAGPKVSGRIWVCLWALDLVPSVNLSFQSMPIVVIILGVFSKARHLLRSSGVLSLLWLFLALCSLIFISKYSC